MSLKIEAQNTTTLEWVALSSLQKPGDYPREVSGYLAYCRSGNSVSVIKTLPQKELTTEQIMEFVETNEGIIATLNEGDIHYEIMVKTDKYPNGFIIRLSHVKD